jgi:hypothetical protein
MAAGRPPKRLRSVEYIVDSDIEHFGGDDTDLDDPRTGSSDGSSTDDELSTAAFDSSDPPSPSQIPRLILKFPQHNTTNALAPPSSSMTAGKKRKRQGRDDTEDGPAGEYSCFYPSSPIVIHKNVEGETVEITYILDIFTCDELRKSVSKQVAKRIQFMLPLDADWSSMKSEIATSIAASESTSTLDLNNYAITYYIPRHVSKPGLQFTSESDYTSLCKKLKTMTRKTPISVNLIASEKKKEGSDNKENEGVDAKEEKKKVWDSFIVYLSCSQVESSSA